MADFDEREFKTSAGEILVTDEQLSPGAVLAIGLTDKVDEGHFAYLELTITEAEDLIDELERRLDAEQASRLGGRRG